MIVIELSDPNYEYEIRALFMAFCPNQEIKVRQIEKTELQQKELKETELEQLNEKNRVGVTLVEGKIKVIFSDNQIEILIWLKGQPIVKKIVKLNKVVVDNFSIMEQNKDKEQRTNNQRNLQEIRQYKNQLKRALYEVLSHTIKKELPWGTLTGIRPTKIPLEKLEQGESEQSIINHMETEYLCSKEKAKLSVQIAKKEQQLLRNINDKTGYSIYIGIPFCPTTCLYCSFTSYSIQTFAHLTNSYLEALFREMDFISSNSPNKKLTTIYIGGGTPTTLTEQQLELLLKKVHQVFNFTYVIEFTVEAGRPDSITYEKLQILKQYGVNRISINPQTMNQQTLDLIGRKHTVEQIEQAFSLARKAEHDNINMDLILGLPGENITLVKQTMEHILQLNPDSLTIHTLAIKRAAFLNIYHNKYKELMATDTKEQLEFSAERVRAAGYKPYYLYRQKNMAQNLENIGYSREGKEGIYNILIMEERQTIIALGAGASSKFVFQKENQIERAENVKSVTDYISRIDEMIERKRSLIERIN